VVEVKGNNAVPTHRSACHSCIETWGGWERHNITTLRC